MAAEGDVRADVERGRAGRAVRVGAAVLAVFWGLLFFGATDLLVFLQGPEFHSSFHLETGWGLFYLVLVTVPLAAVAAAPRAVLPTALQQVVLTAVAVAVGAVLSTSPAHLLPAFGLLATAGLLAAGSTGLRSALPVPRRWAVWPTVLVLLAAGPWLGYALAAASSARAGRHVDITNGLTHFPLQAALAVGVVLVAALAAGHPRGWAVPTGCAALSSAWLGAASVVYPDLDASLGRAWGAAAVAWGAAFAAATCLAGPRRR